MKLRTVVFWMHLTAGVFAGTVVLIMSVTGVLLMYERQMMAWADSGFRSAPPSAEARRLSADELVAKFRAERPQVTPGSLTIRSERDAPAAFAGAPGAPPVYVDQYSGAVLGDGNAGLRAFFRKVTDWHRWLATDADNRAIGRAITGACNLAFLFIVVSGFYMWWPKQWTWTQFKSILWFRRLQGKARDFNWHNVIGIWSAAPLFLIVLSGVVISYPWAGNLVYRVAGEAPPTPPARPPAPGGPGGAAGAGGPGGPATAPAGGSGAAAEGGRRGRGAPPELQLAGVEQALKRAEGHVADWRSISFRLPTNAEAPLAVTIDTGNGGQPQRRGTLTLNRADGEVVKWEGFSDATPGRRLRLFLRFAHTGEVAGLLGQTVAGLVSAGGAVLVWTGLALCWRRFRSWRSRKTRPAASQATPDEAAA